jgi:hypothetical protein
MTERKVAFGQLFEEVVESGRVAKQWGQERELDMVQQQLYEEFAAQIVCDVIARNEQEGEYDDMSAYFSNSLYSGDT